MATYAFALALPVWRPANESSPGLAFATVALLFWVLGWDSAIRYTATHLSVTNLLVTSTVTWQDVSRVAMEDGLHIELRDGRALGSIAFGDSLIGGFTGYPSHRRAHRLLRDAHRKADRDGAVEGAVRVRLSVEWRRLLVAAAAVYGPVLVVLVIAR